MPTRTVASTLPPPSSGAPAFFGALVAVLALLGYIFWSGYHTDHREALIEVRNLADSLAINVEGILDRAESDIRVFAPQITADDLSGQAPEARRIDLETRMGNHLRAFPAVLSYRAFDAVGEARLGAGPANPHAKFNVADRAWFQQLRDGATGGPIVSEVVVSKVTGEKTIIVGITVRDKDGHFVGAFGAAINLAELQRQIDALNIGPGGLVAVRRTDNYHLVLRRPHADPHLNKAPAEGRTGGTAGAIAEAQRTGAKSSEGDFVAPLDGISRTFAYRSLEHFPLAIVVGVSPEDYRGPWRKQAALGGVAALVFIGTLIQLYRRHQRTQGLLIDAAERHRALMATAGDGIHIVDMGNRLVDASNSFYRMLGYPSDRPPALTIRDWETGTDSIAAVMTGLATETSHVFETRYRRADGTVLDVEVSVSRFTPGGTQLLYASSRDITERKRAEADAARNLAVTNALGRTLQLSLTGMPLAEILGKALDELLSLTWLNLENQGCVFLMDNDGLTLRMVTNRNLASEIVTACATVATGGCLCGRAAGERRIIHKDCVDPDHEIRFAGMGGHGHYCVPIIWGGRVVGVINAYVAQGHLRSEGEEAVLALFADTLAGIIGRRKAEDALRESQDLATTLMDATADAAFLADRDGILLSANHALAERFATSADKMVGKSFFDLLPGDLAAIRRAQYLRVIETGEASHIQDERDGLVLDNRVYPVRGHDGLISGVAVFSHDITDRQRSEQEIRNLLAYQRGILANSPIGIAILTEERRVIEANAAFCRIYGRAGEDLIGKNARILYGNEAQYEDIGRRGYPVVIAGGTFSDDVLMARWDGSEIWVRLTAHLVDLTNPSLGVMWTAEDVSERKLLELDLKRSNAELEQFAYVASHDLRQPLRMVTSYLGLIKQQMGDDPAGDVKQFLDFAVAGARRMDRLILDLLEYSRTGRTNASEQVSLGTVVADALDNLVVAIRDADGQVVVAEDLPTVQGDPMELTRLFQNLIGNAIKYRAPERPPRVEISCRRNENEWLLAIRDNGIGIAPKDRDRAFAIFQRLVKPDAYEGTGIGLAICKKIVEHHGGRIWIESEPGTGSTFFFTIRTGFAAL